MDLDLSPLLNAESIAIIGVSSDPSRVGGRLFRYIVKHSYKGKIYLVNPKYSEINGLKCYSSLSEIPDIIDCVLISVASDKVISVLNECVKCKSKSAIIISAGFAETGDFGREKQREIRELARNNNLRICGPNCVGLINFHSKTALAFSQFLEIESLLPGNIALVSQSGALGGSLLNRAQDKGIGFSYFISTGNEADLEVSDFINYLVRHDKNTDVIAALVEGFKDGAKFVEAAELALLHKKPIIVLKLGETDTGKRATASHTGTLAGSDPVIDALFKKKGIIRVNHYDELLETASLFSKGLIPKGNRVGIITSSGGAGIIMADYYTKLGLKVPEPSRKTKELSSKEIPSFAQVNNPFDLTAQLMNRPEMFQKCMKIFIKDDVYDIIQVNVSMSAKEYSKNRAIAILEVANETEKPVVSWWAAGSLSEPGINILDKSKVTVFKSPDRCAKAVKSLVEYYNFIREYKKSDKSDSEIEYKIPLANAKRIIQKADGVLSEHQSKELLALCGIPVTKEKLAKSVEEAILFAKEIGYPIVLKIDSPQILHKTEIEAIKLNINSKDELIKAYEEIINNVKRTTPDAKINGVLVQETIHGGIEVIIGVSQDIQFGPTIAFGMGGIYVELLKDISLNLIPLSRYDADLMVKQIKGYQILQGYRRKYAADIEAIIDTLLKLSRLTESLKDYISEIDINPLIVFDKGHGVKALDALVVLK